MFYYNFLYISDQVLLLTERLKLTTTSSAKEIQDKENDVAGVYEAKCKLFIYNISIITLCSNNLFFKLLEC